VVGVLDDGPASLSARALALVDQAEVLAGGERHLAFFPRHPAERIVLKGGLATAVERLRAGLGQRRQVVLASGDPLFYGIGKHLIERLGRNAVEVIPNLSAMQLAFARAKISWEDAALLSVHGRPAEAVVEAVRQSAKCGLFTDDRNTPAALAALFLARGVDNRRAYVCENLGGPAERVVETVLQGLVGQAFAPLNVLILVREE
jgi:precorrin-6Y C5,15-methyltransferase (decarboxylating)